MFKISSRVINMLLIHETSVSNFSLSDFRLKKKCIQILFCFKLKYLRIVLKCIKYHLKLNAKYLLPIALILLLYVAKYEIFY